MCAVSDDDSQFEDEAEDDGDHFEEASNDVVESSGASDTLEVDEASFVDSREDLDEDRSDDESID